MDISRSWSFLKGEAPVEDGEEVGIKIPVLVPQELQRVERPAPPEELWSPDGFLL